MPIPSWSMSSDARSNGLLLTLAVRCSEQVDGLWNVELVIDEETRDELSVYSLDSALETMARYVEKVRAKGGLNVLCS